VALAGRVIASHYAEPVERSLRNGAMLRAGPSTEAESLAQLGSGDPFLLLDDSLGWAWGYAGKDRIVGYLPSDTLAALVNR
jgi:dipeptidyl peptidase-like protein